MLLSALHQKVCTSALFALQGHHFIPGGEASIDMLSDVYKPSWINADAVSSICTVLHNSVAPGSRSRTKVVLLSAYPVTPGLQRSSFVENMLVHQYNDLSATQDFLLKQKGWLDSLYIMPGLIVDSETDLDLACTAAIELKEGGEPVGVISYARLAAAMQLAAGDPRWVGKFATPVATTKVGFKFKHLESQRELFQALFTKGIVPYVGRTLAWITFGAGVGYFLGSRDGGAWMPRNLGVNVGS